MFRRIWSTKRAVAVVFATLSVSTSSIAIARADDLAEAPPHPSTWLLAAKAEVASGAAHITANVTAPYTAHVIVDTEIYDEDGRKTVQWYSEKSVKVGATLTMDYNWPIPSNGRYTVKQGVFSEKWKSQLAWSDDAISFSKAPKSAAPAAPLPVASPVSLSPKPATARSTDHEATGVASTGDLKGAKFYGSNKAASRQAASWQATRPGDAALMEQLAAVPTATWFGDWSGEIKSAVDRQVSAATAQHSVAVLVAYNIPGRDCGKYSAGGASSEAQYDNWIDNFAAGIGSRKTVVILEPDALAQMCGDVAARYRMLNHAVTALSKQKGAVTYLDAGNARWVPAAEMTKRLQLAGVSKARGFALNVSNFLDTNDNEDYGDLLSGALGGKHYVVDTSRNGRGSNGEWCNPADRSIGLLPTTLTASPNADAYLWIKTAGESDGACNGGPAAGAWWPDYALGLAKAAWG